MDEDKIMDLMEVRGSSDGYDQIHQHICRAEFRAVWSELGTKDGSIDYNMTAKEHLLNYLKELFGVDDDGEKATCNNCYHGNYRDNYYENDMIYKKHCKVCARNPFNFTQDNFIPKEPKA